MGVSSGVATLDTTGKVPSSQLPSYVDDVLEYTNKAGFPTTGESGKIYIDKATNITYRWSGTTYVEISPSLALGETSSTAYPGNKGKTTTDNVNAILAGTKVVPKATDANTLDGKDSTNFASAADLAKKLDKSGGTMEGVFNVDTLYFKVNTASGYRQAFGTIRGGLLALGSDELPAALYGYNKDQKPQWVYKEGSNYVFKDLAIKEDVPQIKEVTAQFTPTTDQASGAREASIEIDMRNLGITNWQKFRVMYIHCAILHSSGGTSYEQNGYMSANSYFLNNNGYITVKTYGCVPNQPNTVIVGYMELK